MLHISCPHGVSSARLLSIIFALAFCGSSKLWSEDVVSSTVAGNTAIPVLYADGVGRDARFHGCTGIAADSAGNLYIADYSNHVIRKASSAGIVSTLAGQTNVQGIVDGTGPTAAFAFPTGICADASGNVYVTDSNYVRKIAPGGVVTTLAGSPTAGEIDGTGSAAQFNGASGITVDSAGNLYVADRFGNTIRRVTNTGVVTTLAGSGTSHGEVDGGPAIARFDGPVGIAIDGSGLLWVSDWNGSTMRTVSITTGVVTTVAGVAYSPGYADGTGASARFALPCYVAADASGRVLVVDSQYETIRLIASGGVTSTFIGSHLRQNSHVVADGTGGAALCFSPTGIAIGPDGNAYVCDSDWSMSFVRKITPGGVISMYLGNNATGYQDGTNSTVRSTYGGIGVDSSSNLILADTVSNAIRKVTQLGVASTICGAVSAVGSADGTGSAASFNGPNDVAVAADGTMYVADGNNYTIRKVTTAGVVTTFAGRTGFSQLVDGTGTAAYFTGVAGIAMDASGNSYVAGGYAIRKITPTAVVTTVAGGTIQGTVDGTGTAARFYNPQGIAVDGSGNLYVADGYLLRKITTAGVVTTLAGSATSAWIVDGTGSAARFSQLLGVACDRFGNIYVLDRSQYNRDHSSLKPNGGMYGYIRRVTSSGVVTTILGGGSISGPTDGIGVAASIGLPVSGYIGLRCDSAGNIYWIDGVNGAVRKAITVPTIVTQPVPQVQWVGSSASFSVQSIGIQPLLYQWSKSVNGGSTWATISGATSASYTTPALVAADNGSIYRCAVTNSVGTTTSATAALTAYNNPSLAGLTTPLTLDSGVASGAIHLTISGGLAPYSLQATTTNAVLIPTANVVFGGSGTAPTVVITPVAGQTGTATITIAVTDANGRTASQSSTVTVNAFPTLTGLTPTFQTDMAISTGALPFTIGGGTGSLTVTAASSYTALVPVASCVFGGSGANRTVTITPAASQVGTATVTITASDTLGVKASQMVNVRVNPLPTIANLPATLGTDINVATDPVPFAMLNGTGTLTPTAVSSNQTLLPTANCVFGGSGADRTLTVTPAAGKTGTATITVTVTDSLNKTATQTIAFTVNAAPTFVLNGSPVTTDAGVPVTVGTYTVTGGTAPKISVATDNANLLPPTGCLLSGPVTSGSLIATSVPGHSGTGHITLTMTDSAHASIAVVSPLITVNDAMLLRGLPATLTVNQGVTPAAQALSVSGGTGTITMTATSSNTAVLPTPTLSGGGANWTMTLAPVAGQTGASTITVTATDGLSQKASATCLFTVVAMTPTVPDAIYGCPINVSYLQRGIVATSPSGALLTFSATQPLHGTVTLPDATSFQYTPQANYVGLDTFTITATNSSGQGTGTITIAVGVDPERSLLVRPTSVESFNASRWGTDAGYRATYLAGTLPNRVWSTAQGSASVPMLQIVGPGDIPAAVGATVQIRAKSQAGAPVSFAATANGTFGTHNAVTVLADATGVATAMFTAPSVACRCPILIGSPLAVSTQRVVVEVMP